jgi:DTW domain-containing protein YfiP
MDRCTRCFLKLPRCICAQIPRVPARTRLLLVRHAMERWKTSNSGRLATMALEGARLVDVGVQDVADDVPAFGPDAWLLWPDGEVLATPPEVKTLIVLDGTWPQTRRMMQRMAMLRGLPRLSLAGGLVERKRLRKPPRPGEMSTLEAIAEAIAWLEGDEVAAPLFELYDRFVVASTPEHDRKVIT